MVPQKPQVWSSCKAHDAVEWQRHFERHATPQMGRNCGFWVEEGIAHGWEWQPVVCRLTFCRSQLAQ
jgi:hypothetical protein